MASMIWSSASAMFDCRQQPRSVEWIDRRLSALEKQQSFMRTNNHHYHTHANTRSFNHTNAQYNETLAHIQARIAALQHQKQQRGRHGCQKLGHADTKYGSATQQHPRDSHNDRLSSAARLEEAKRAFAEFLAQPSLIHDSPETRTGQAPSPADLPQLQTLTAYDSAIADLIAKREAEKVEHHRMTVIASMMDAKQRILLTHQQQLEHERNDRQRQLESSLMKNQSWTAKRDQYHALEQEEKSQLTLIENDRQMQYNDRLQSLNNDSHDDAQYRLQARRHHRYELDASRVQWQLEAEAHAQSLEMRHQHDELMRVQQRRKQMEWRKNVELYGHNNVLSSTHTHNASVSGSEDYESRPLTAPQHTNQQPLKISIDLARETSSNSNNYSYFAQASPIDSFSVHRASVDDSQNHSNQLNDSQNDRHEDSQARAETPAMSETPITPRYDDSDNDIDNTREFDDEAPAPPRSISSMRPPGWKPMVHSPQITAQRPPSKSIEALETRNADLIQQARSLDPDTIRQQRQREEAEAKGRAVAEVRAEAERVVTKRRQQQQLDEQRRQEQLERERALREEEEREHQRREELARIEKENFEREQKEREEREMQLQLQRQREDEEQRAREAQRAHQAAEAAAKVHAQSQSSPPSQSPTNEKAKESKGKSRFGFFTSVFKGKKNKGDDSGKASARSEGDSGGKTKAAAKSKPNSDDDTSDSESEAPPQAQPSRFASTHALTSPAPFAALAAAPVPAPSHPLASSGGGRSSLVMTGRGPLTMGGTKPLLSSSLSLSQSKLAARPKLAASWNSSSFLDDLGGDDSDTDSDENASGSASSLAMPARGSLLSPNSTTQPRTGNLMKLGRSPQPTIRDDEEDFDF